MEAPRDKPLHYSRESATRDGRVFWHADQRAANDNVTGASRLAFDDAVEITAAAPARRLERRIAGAGFEPATCGL